MSGEHPVIPEEFWPAACVFCSILRRALAMSQAQEGEPVAPRSEGGPEAPAPQASDEATTIVTEMAGNQPVEREKAA